MTSKKHISWVCSCKDVRIGDGSIGVEENLQQVATFDEIHKIIGQQLRS